MKTIISFKEFERKYKKQVDTWVERTVCDKLGVIIAYLFYIIDKRRTRKLPYYITCVTFSLRLISAILFYYGLLILGAFSYLVSMILDSADGILSRSYFDKDPELRGTLDVMFDLIGLSFVLIALAFRFYDIASYKLLLLILIYTTFVFLYEFSAATRFRIFSKLSLDPDNSIINFEKFKQNTINSKIVYYYLKIKNITEKRGFFFYPTIVDSEFLLFVIAPIFKFPFVIIAVSLVFIAIEVILGLTAVIWIIKNLNNMSLS